MPETIQKPEVTRLYRVENPNIHTTPNGVTSHVDIVGGWFSPNPSKAFNYLRKYSRTFGPQGKRVAGARLVVADVASSDLEGFHASNNPTVIAERLEFEPEDYVLPRDGSVAMAALDLDPFIDRDDRARLLGNPEVSARIQREVLLQIGGIAAIGAQASIEADGIRS